MAKASKISHPVTRKSSGSVVPVGSKAGKILINSIDASKIMEAVRKVIRGEKAEQVELSGATIDKLRLLAVKK